MVNGQGFIAERSAQIAAMQQPAKKGGGAGARKGAAPDFSSFLPQAEPVRLSVHPAAAKNALPSLQKPQGVANSNESLPLLPEYVAPAFSSA